MSLDVEDEFNDLVGHRIYDGHITKVSVIQGNDDYLETDRYEFDVDNKEQLNPKRIQWAIPKKTKLRQRLEPMVLVEFACEATGEPYWITIGQHKGCIIVESNIKP